MHQRLREILPDRLIPGYLLRFYGVGLVLFILPFTRSLFIHITWLTLILVIAIVLLRHRGWNAKTVLWFLFIAVTSFLIEMKGIATGEIFGRYSYDIGLGPQVRGTPLIIGLNWLFLTYASHDIALRVAPEPLMRIVLGAQVMVLYDLAMEWVAPAMRMWHFEGNYPPLVNFAAWFAIALLYQTGFELLGIRSDNLPGRTAFGIQIVFFATIGVFSMVFPG